MPSASVPKVLPFVEIRHMDDVARRADVVGERMDASVRPCCA
jgi:hypothetical protein